MNAVIVHGTTANLPSVLPPLKAKRRQRQIPCHAAQLENAVSQSDLGFREARHAMLDTGLVQHRNGLYSLSGGVSFGGAGIFFWWELGCVMWLLDYVDIDTCAFFGASGGALAATLAACRVDPFDAFDVADRLTEENKLFERPLGLAGVWGKLIEDWLEELLPENAAEICNDRVNVVVTTLPKLELTSFSKFESKESLIEANMASAHIPFFLNGDFCRRFRDIDCIDGSFQDFFSGSNSDLLTRDGRTLLFDYFDDERLKRKRFDFLALKQPSEVKEMIYLGYEYAERLSKTDKFAKLLSNASLQSSVELQNSAILWTA